jgi:hypothetical protein
MGLEGGDYCSCKETNKTDISICDKYLQFDVGNLITCIYIYVYIGKQVV